METQMPHRYPRKRLIAGLASGLKFCLPVSLGLLGASVTGSGPSAALSAPLAVAALVLTIFWWRRLPARAPRRPNRDDDDFGGRGWHGDHGPFGPGDGPGGLEIDWTAFERDFWAHVARRGRRISPAR
jgi:hypothetical protein